MSGFATFGVLGYHLRARHVLSESLIPVVYAAAMGIHESMLRAAAYRGARVQIIYGGTTEIMKEIIGRNLKLA
ncbi:hypothetical protein KHQ06_31320 [Nocardia tengchongensis]|uniref:Acyl-CoA dehydrogenase/oxidase C-terminal domain-containing protein n=1 Tax=Nocardia tengchongensis TaxID=2055889 RepID=A0ABX8CZA4_9NOCA|nr:hypothetical protein KHQ06_31320 [Nocardia tengchongensis]